MTTSEPAATEESAPPAGGVVNPFGADAGEAPAEGAAQPEQPAAGGGFGVGDENPFGSEN